MVDEAKARQGYDAAAAVIGCLDVREGVSRVAKNI